MGKRLEKMQLCEKDGSRRCFSSRGLFSVFQLWQSCSNHSDGMHSKNLVFGTEHPKGKLNLLINHDGKHEELRDKLNNKIHEADAGKRTEKELLNEESSTGESKFGTIGFLEKKEKSGDERRNLSQENKEAEAFINEALKRYLYKDRRNQRSQRFLDAITMLKSNEELFLKLIQDPNSLLVKHIGNLQDLHAEKERSKLVQKSKCLGSVISATTNNSEEVVGNTKKFQKQNTYDLAWDKIKTRYEYPSKLRKHPQALGSVEVSENVGWRCSSLHSCSSKNKNKIVDPLYISFKTKSKSMKEDGKEHEGCRKLGFKQEIALADDNARKSFSSLSVRYSKGRDFDIVEEEAKRHLSERLMNVNRTKCFSNKETPRILGKILHLPQSRIFDLELDKLRNRLLDTKEHGGISSMTDCISSADQMGNVEIINFSQPGDFNILEFPFSPSSTNDTTVEQNTGSVSSSLKVDDSGCSGQESSLEYRRLKSSLDDSSSTPKSFRDLQITDRGGDKTDLLSPVSVLENLFHEDFDSPPSIETQPDKPPIQPLHIDFEEPSLKRSSTDIEISSESSIEEFGLISTYMDALLKITCSSWDELFLSCQCPYSSNQFFDPTFIDEIKLPFIDSYDQKLYFDSVNEAASEVYQSYFTFSPFVSLMQSKPHSTSAVDEIKRRVDQYFHPPALSETAEQLAGQDHVSCQGWADIREDIEEITNQVAESIVAELVTKTIFEILA